MTYKKPIIKTNKLNLIIYNNGYICNGDYIIKADLVELDNPVLQDKINKNEPFSLNNKRLSTDTPNLLQLLPTYNDSFTLLTDTELEHESHQYKTRNYYNESLQCFTAIQKDYITMFNKTGYHNNYKQAVELGGVAVFDNNNEVLFYVMPVQLPKDSFLKKVEIKKGI